MTYTVVFKPRSLKDLKAITPDECKRIVAKVEDLQNNLTGDVKS